MSSFLSVAEASELCYGGGMRFHLMLRVWASAEDEEEDSWFVGVGVTNHLVGIDKTHVRQL